MKNMQGIALALLVTAGLVAAAPGTMAAEAASAKLIVGGHDVPQDAYPFQASLQLAASGKHHCGATLVSPTTLVTAAHCVFDEQKQEFRPAQLQAAIGRVSLSDVGRGEERGIAAIAIDPRYDRNRSYDIAYLSLTEPVTDIAPVALPAPDARSPLAAPGRMATIVGWGYTEADPTPLPDRLQGADLPLQPAKRCAAELWHESALRLCAGGAGKGVSFGDSGGPLLVDDGGTVTQIGIVSSSGETPGLGGFTSLLSPDVRSWKPDLSEPTA
ncbi:MULTISPECIES: S1 family peptidase [Bacteria]|uniref:S1 family peptidase n=1 Tax=Bacteria TaxID=2 RepID=UPI003C7B6766